MFTPGHSMLIHNVLQNEDTSCGPCKINKLISREKLLWSTEKLTLLHMFQTYSLFEKLCLRIYNIWMYTRIFFKEFLYILKYVLGNGCI
jgi:hypothetical protein